MKIKTHYEARLNRNISRNNYGKTTYKKGTLIWICTEKQFEKLTSKNIHNYTDFCICEGHGVYEYFDLEKDIEFVKVEIITKKKEKVVKLKK
jgi:hypothetical protein